MTSALHSVQLTEIIFPEHSNHYGTLFGGQALLLMSKAAFLAARGFAQADVVMAGCREARFLHPVAQGSVLTLQAWVRRAGRSSLAVQVQGQAESGPGTGHAGPALGAWFDLVAVDSQGRPAPLTRAAGLPACRPADGP